MTKKLDRETAVELNMPITHGANATIKEFMEYYDVTTEDLTERCGFNLVLFQRFLDGELYLGVADALELEAVTGISAQLLVNMELAYARVEYEGVLEEEVKAKRYDFVKGESDESNQ